MSHVVVIGAGQAGAAVVAKLRAGGFDGALTLIGAEEVPPYQRPPLSKAYLLGEMPVERLFLRPESFYAENAITLRLGTRVTGIAPADKTVTLSTGEELGFDHLVLATGAAPRRLPAAVGGDLGGVLCMRDLADADMMAPLLQPGKRLLIIGGGYIGLEAAAVARKRGLHVTLVEMADRILQRVAAPATSDYFRKLHRDHGVEICEATGLDALTGEGRVTGARLSDGRELEVDFALLGVGVNPDTALADAAGLTVQNGIVTDAFGRTSDPAIWAAGDCASLPYQGAQIRIESVGNAIDQAEAVAMNILGAETPYTPRPWFWSDQYNCKLQIAGLNTGYDAVHVRPGAAPGAQSHWYYAGTTLLAVDAMNDPRAYMIGKRLIEAARSPLPGQITDPGTDLKSLMQG